jgi:hypothetical protein
MSSDISRVIEATQALATALSNQSYAVVGGAALVLLGSTRVTSYVDLVVPQGMTSATRRALREHADYFEVDSRTLHTSYKSDPATTIEILTPPSLFRETFD